jgi:hypothetical protein
MDTAAVAENTAEAVETVLETVEAVPQVVRNNPLALAGVAVVSLAVGATVSWYVTRRILRKRYDVQMEEEIEKTRRFYKELHKTDEFSDPSVLAEQYRDEVTEEIVAEDEVILSGVAKEVAREERYVSYDKVQPVEERVEVEASIRKNIFDTPPVASMSDKYDLDEELEKKQRGEPYILEYDEFFENPDDLSTSSLTYFVDDDTMLDEQDVPIQHYERIVGENNLKFGHGSKDPRVVYIRNDELQASYEIVKTEGSIAEMFGIASSDEVRHSDRSSRRFRNVD